MPIFPSGYKHRVYPNFGYIHSKRHKMYGTVSVHVCIKSKSSREISLNFAHHLPRMGLFAPSLSISLSLSLSFSLQTQRRRVCVNKLSRYFAYTFNISILVPHDTCSVIYKTSGGVVH